MWPQISEPLTIALLTFFAALLNLLAEMFGLLDIGPRRLWRWLARKLAQTYWNIAGQTIQVIPFNQHFLWWGNGTINGKPMMQVVGDFHFTNLTTEPTLIVKTYLVAYYKKWKLVPRKTRVEGNIMVQHHRSGMHGTHHQIFPRDTTEGRADWIVEPPICTPGEALVGRVCFIDRFGNEHWTGKLKWEYH